MEKEISIQIHDYDAAGRYGIVEDRKATKAEVKALKEKARKSVKLEWDKLPVHVRHIVYYGEILDKSGEVWFAAIFMHGEAYGSSDFDMIFTAKNIGYVGAYHKRD